MITLEYRVPFELRYHRERERWEASIFLSNLVCTESVIPHIRLNWICIYSTTSMIQILQRRTTGRGPTRTSLSLAPTIPTRPASRSLNLPSGILPQWPFRPRAYRTSLKDGLAIVDILKLTTAKVLAERRERRKETNVVVGSRQDWDGYLNSLVCTITILS